MRNVSISREGLPETVLPPENPEIVELLDAALQLENQNLRREKLNQIAGRFPSSIEVWKTMGLAGRDTMESYAAFRVGYHRGLDALRKNGWRGSGYVRWGHPSNRAFLECLSGLQRISEQIGDFAESERCGIFLLQLDPEMPDNL
ncbi:MAG: hypothetical protein CL457_04345 [Acidimicrobiaceae bacterium]|nr:hypothetical protein [Acidimicrobiaceae bacterium]